jgi:hypothetical protein
VGWAMTEPGLDRTTAAAIWSFAKGYQEERRRRRIR